MIREIKKKMLILRNRMPFPQNAKDYFGYIETEDWIYNNIRLEGGVLDRQQISSLVSGEVIGGLSVSDHLLAQRLKQLLDKMYEYADMRYPLDLHTIADFHNIITGEKDKGEEGYRKRNTVVREYDFVPLIPMDIPKAMRQLQFFVFEKKDIEPTSEEVFDVAAKIHNKIIEIFPYGEGDKLLARAAMAYYILLQGYPATVFHSDEVLYNHHILSWLKSKDFKEFKQCIMSGISAKLDIMIQLTAY